VVHATGVVGAQGSAAVQPTCPSGQVATGGGYRQTSLSTVSHSVFANRPSGGSAWNVGYYGQPGDEFRGSVVCIKIPQDAPLEVRTTTESFAVPGQSTGTGIVRCNSAEAISGGGWFVSNIRPDSYMVRTNQPAYRRLVGHHWRLGVFSDLPADSPELAVLAYAVCVRTAY